MKCQIYGYVKTSQKKREDPVFSLSFTFNFMLSTPSMLNSVFVLNLLRKRQPLFELKLLGSFCCGKFYLSAEFLAHDVNYWLYQ